MQKKLWPLNRSVERRIPMGIGHSRCRIGRMELCFEREFESGGFAMGKWLRIACFLTSVFLIINVFPHFSRKKNRATSSPESRTYPFSTHSVVNSPSVSRRTTSRTPTVSPSRVFCEVVRLSKMKSSLYQDDFKIPLEILWIYTPWRLIF